MTDAKRNRWGQYLIATPDGKETGHQRATTFAKAISDSFGLTDWKLRSAAAGIVARPDILARLAALRDPVNEDKKEANRLVQDAIEASKASSGANLGTALHSFTEHLDRGLEHAVPEQWAADVAAYQTTLAAAGVTMNPEYIERIVVLDDLQVAGTFDRIVTIDGRQYIADLKTGKDPAAFPHEICLQLSLYANADALWNTDTETREPMPEVDKNRALVIHLPPGKGECSLWWFDIAAGWDMVSTVTAVKDWRKRKGLTTPYSADLGVMALGVTDKGQPTRITKPRAEVLPIPKADPPAPTDDGPEVPGAVDQIRKAVEAMLDTEQTATLRQWVRDGRSPHMWVVGTDTQTRRRLDLHRAAVRLIRMSWSEGEGTDDDLVRAVIHTITADDAVLQPAIKIGMALGAMTLTQAAALVELATLIEGDPKRASLDAAGRWSVAA